MRTSDPIAVVEAALAAIAREDWEGAAALFDPVSLVAFRRLHVEARERVEEHEPPTVEGMLRRWPDMTREAADERAAVLAERGRLNLGSGLPDDFVGVQTLDELRALSPAALYARRLEAQSDRHQLRRMGDRGVVPRATIERQLAVLSDLCEPAYRCRVLGMVPDGERLAHVVLRFEFRPPEPGAREHPMVAEDRERRARLPADERLLDEEVRDTGRAQTVLCRLQPDGGWRIVAEDDFVRPYQDGVVIYDFSEPDDFADAPADDAATGDDEPAPDA